MGISKVIAETSAGSFGFLPHRLDCVTALYPGILTYKIGSEEIYVAIDQGILTKTGLTIHVSARNAISGTDLSKLKKTVEQEFSKLTEEEENLRFAMDKMESSFIHRLAEFRHE
jgi:F-type H+-transporting ATPase subunit epsilon